jgi:MraZ protein
VDKWEWVGYSGAQWTMLLGEHEHSLDDKNRLTLPAKLRSAFSEGVILTAGLDGCLYAYPRAEWEVLAERIRNLDPLAEGSRVMRRVFFGAAAQGELDRQGRMVIPAPLLTRAKLERDVTVLGVWDHLEIWDRAAWRTRQSDDEGRAEDVAERLAN